MPPVAKPTSIRLPRPGQVEHETAMSQPQINPNFVVNDSRPDKARKIAAVLTAHLGRPLDGLSILDVGVGNGEIIDSFAEGNDIHGVDVLDSRTSKKAAFHLVKGEKLPFVENMFDVVITNHVIEHVGKPARHAAEIYRVLKPGGIAYVATPNRIFPKEPHYKLWLLHYLPLGFYHQAAGRLGLPVDWFWCFMPGGLRKAFVDAGFSYRNYTGDILADPDRFALEAKYRLPLPGALVRALANLSPTLIGVARKPE